MRREREKNFAPFEGEKRPKVEILGRRRDRPNPCQVHHLNSIFNYTRVFNVYDSASNTLYICLCTISNKLINNRFHVYMSTLVYLKAVATVQGSGYSF